MNIHHTYQSICRNAETISQGSCFKTNSLYCTSKFTVPPVILSMNASTVKYRRVSSFSTCTLDVSTQHFQLLLNPAICQPLTAVPSVCSIAPAQLFDDVCAFLPAPWGPNNSASWNDNTCGGSQARTHQKWRKNMELQKSWKNLDESSYDLLNDCQGILALYGFILIQKAGWWPSLALAPWLNWSRHLFSKWPMSNLRRQGFALIYVAKLTSTPAEQQTWTEGQAMTAQN